MFSTIGGLDHATLGPQQLNVTSIALIITSVTGAVLGLLGWWSGKTRDTTAAENTAKDVATRASRAAVEALEAALDVLERRVADQLETITAQGVKITRQGDQIADLKMDQRRCEDEKKALTKRVHELETAR